MWYALRGVCEGGGEESRWISHDVRQRRLLLLQLIHAHRGVYVHTYARTHACMRIRMYVRTQPHTHATSSRQQQR